MKSPHFFLLVFLPFLLVPTTSFTKEGTKERLNTHNFLKGSAKTPTTIEDSVEKTINVQAFGAIGDNKHDDGPAIQAALNHIDSIGGGVVYFPDGNYIINNPRNGDNGIGKNGLRIGSNTTLKFSAKATMYKTGNNEVVSNKDWKKGDSNISIIGGTFKTPSGTDEGWAPSRTGILLINTRNSTVSRSRFEHIGNTGIVIIGANSRFNKVANCYFHDVRNASVVFEGEKNIVTGCTASLIGGDGIIINGKDCTVSNNHLDNIGHSDEPGGSGIALGADKNLAFSNKIINNVINDAYANGIIADRGSSTLMETNTITNIGGIGIKIGGDGHNSIISNNTIKNTGTRKNVKSIYANTGMLIDGANVQIKNNVLNNVEGTGIYINNFGIGSILTNNKINKTTNADDNAVKNAGIEIHANNVTVSGGYVKNAYGDACLLFGNISNIKITGATFGSSQKGYAIRIDGDTTNKPTNVIITNCISANISPAPAGSAILFGSNITIDKKSAGKLFVSSKVQNLKKIANNLLLR